MKTLLLGLGGQLGRDLGPLLPGQVIALTRADADFATQGALTAAVKARAPDVVVNCAGYNHVNRAEAEPDPAFAVNAWAVREVAAACGEVDAKLVHVSTDNVFGLDTTRTGPYAEDDAPGPISSYGVSKLVGEYFARSLAPKNLVIRTCGLYGLRGSGGKGGNIVETSFARLVSGNRCKR